MHTAAAIRYLILEQQIADLEKRVKEDRGELEALKYARSELSTNWLGTAGTQKVKELKQQIEGHKV